MDSGDEKIDDLTEYLETESVKKKSTSKRKKSVSQTKKRRTYIKIKDEFKECSGKQLFRKEWMQLPEFKDWLVEGMFPFQAYCSVCNCNITSGKSELQTHSRSKRHILNLKHLEDKDASSENVTAIVDEFGATHLLRFIDLRSDSLSVPSPEMKYSMIEVTCGDTSFGTDKTVNELEEFVAQMLNKEAGLIFPTHTMANLVAVLTHCQARGSAVIIGEESDINISNSEALVKFGGLHVCPVEEDSIGTFSLEELEKLLKTIDFTFPMSCLVCIECAHAGKGGRVLPLDWIDKLGDLCSTSGSLLHCDGTRLVNASLAQNVPLLRIVKACDSVTLALDKSLGAPIGAVLVGEKAYIQRAHHIREFIGGNIHQAGTYAAAGFFALNQMLANVDYDHEKAKAIALAIAKGNNSFISVDYEAVETNIIHIHCNSDILNAAQLKDRLASVNEDEVSPNEDDESIIILANAVNTTTISLMIHNKISHKEVRRIIQKFLYIMQEYNCDEST